MEQTVDAAVGGSGSGREVGERRVIDEEGGRR
jgi:hypothetical protein